MEIRAHLPCCVKSLQDTSLQIPEYAATYIGVNMCLSESR